MKWWLKICCFLGLHGADRTEHVGECKCPTCGGSYWGRVTENSYMGYMGEWKWYSAKKLKQIEVAGEMKDLICGTGRYSK